MNKMHTANSKGDQILTIPSEVLEETFRKLLDTMAQLGSIRYKVNFTGL